MGNLKFYGCDTVELAKKYGTPLYLLSEDYIVERCDEIKREFLNKYDNTRALYASKAFLTKEMARIIKREGLGMDVVSGGELYTAIQANFPMEKVYFHGNNKSIREIEMAIENNVGRIVVDNCYELDLIELVARKYNRLVKILFRITPGVDSHTHKYIQTGQVDSKFGIPLFEEYIDRVLLKAMKSEYIDLQGFHFHIGSQLMENEPYVKAVKIAIQLMKDVKEKYGFITKELNTGGGYGIQYSGDTERKPLGYFTDYFMEELEIACKKHGIPRPLVVIEPGRWIVGEAGMTLYTIGSIKEIPGRRTYVGIDGGMTDNLRPALYGAKYDGIIANKANREKTEKVTIAGKCCESGDILIWDLKVAKVEPGDILAVLATGAYNYSMSNNYNRIPRPPVVMISKGKDRLTVKRETYEDIMRNEL